MAVSHAILLETIRIIGFSCFGVKPLFHSRTCRVPRRAQWPAVTGETNYGFCATFTLFNFPVGRHF